MPNKQGRKPKHIKFRVLTKAVEHAATETAQRYITSAFDTVEAVLRNLETVRAVRRDEQGIDIRGRLTDNEEDLLRAAIVFAGAGLDASLKRLIRDALPALVDGGHELALDKLTRWAERQLSRGEGADPKVIARYLTAPPHPRGALFWDYVEDLTGSSLQSHSQVQQAASALGVDRSDLRKRIEQLDPAFRARNQIVHELDLRAPEREGDRERRTRRMQESADVAREMLEVGRLIANEVGRTLACVG